MARDYHHGALPVALRAAAVDLIAERGPAAFSLREVARRAGVSHAAPAHHFGDARGLLTSVAAEGYAALAEALEAVAHEHADARDRLLACGLAYVRTAQGNPGHYGVMVGDEYCDNDDPDYFVQSLRAYMALLGAVEAVRDQLNPALDVESAATQCWASMHGLVELAPILQTVADKTGTTTAPIEELVARFTDHLIDGFAAR